MISGSGVAYASDWPALDVLVDDLRQRQRILGLQIESIETLRLLIDNREVQILLRYAVMRSIKKVANSVNEEGWQLQVASGSFRQYKPSDVKFVLDNPPSCASLELMELLRSVFSDNSRKVNAAYN